MNDDLTQHRLARKLQSAATDIRLTPGSELQVIAVGRHRRRRQQRIVAVATIAALGGGTSFVVGQLADTGGGSIATEEPEISTPSTDPSMIDPAIDPTIEVVPTSIATRLETSGGVESSGSDEIETVMAERVDPMFTWNVVEPDSAEAVGFIEGSGRVPGLMISTAPGRSDDYVTTAWWSDDGVSWTQRDISPPNGRLDYTMRVVGDRIYSVGTAPGIAASQPNPLQVSISEDQGETWNTTELPVDVNDRSDLPYVAGSDTAEMVPLDGGAVVLVHRQRYIDVEDLSDQSVVSGEYLNVTDEGIFVYEDPGCSPEYPGERGQVYGAAVSTTIVPQTVPPTLDGQPDGGCPLKFVTWNQLGVPPESVAAVYPPSPAELYLVRNGEVSQIEGPEGVDLAEFWLADPERALFQTNTDSFELATDGSWTRVDLPLQNGMMPRLGSTDDVQFGINYAATMSHYAPSEALIAASSDGQTWTNYDRSGLRSDKTNSWFGPSATTDRYLASIVQSRTDPIAEQGGISTSIDGVTISRASQNSEPVFTLDETGETIELVEVTYQNNNDVVLTNPDSGEVLATITGQQWEQAMTGGEFVAAEGSDVTTTTVLSAVAPSMSQWLIETTTDGLHVASESVADLLGVNADEISAVTRVTSNGTNLVVAVTMTERRANGVLRQLVLVGTPIE